MTTRDAPDRRNDQTTRDRVSSIQGRWEGAIARMWRAIIGLYACMVLIAVGAWVLFDTIQQSRLDAFESTCRATNAQNEAVAEVLSSSRASIRRRQRTGEFSAAEAARREALIDEYIARFPVVKDCALYAERKAALD